MENKIENRYDSVVVFEDKNYQWGVKDLDGNIIVPAGKYGWIDGFDHGLARVRTHKKSGRAGFIIAVINNLDSDNPEIIEGKDKVQDHINKDKAEHPENYAKWGIINKKGEEVLPLEYDDIWNFLGKGRLSTNVVKDGRQFQIYFHDLNHDIPLPNSFRKTMSDDDNFDEQPHYGEYAGSYALDVEGYDDDTIDEAFDGNPDAYWNID
jgi:hypothetical protein